MTARSGRHFLQAPGPTNVPDRVLRAIDQPPIDHRGPEFADLAKRAIAGFKRIVRGSGPVLVYPSSGTGAWEAAILNTLSPGDKVLAFETGHFATLWRNMAQRHGLVVDFVPGDWRHGIDPALVEERLTADKAHEIKAVMVVHNETSTGVLSRAAEIRKAIDAARHPALYMLDVISSLGAMDVRHDDWKVDVTVVGSQKGLMMPPGLAFNAVSTKALEASKAAKLPRGYFDWQQMLDSNQTGSYPYTPAVNLFFGAVEAVAMMEEEGLDNVFARHARLGAATRAAVRGWGLEFLAADPKEYSNALTAVVLPDGHNADAVRKVILDNYNMSLGGGLGKVAGKVFRIAHLGWGNELTSLGAIAGVELGLGAAGVPIRKGGISAAMEVLSVAAGKK